MLAIKINSEFLDLPADTGMEMNRNSPFLNEDIEGEYSLGLTIRYTDKNFRLLSYYGNFYRQHQKLSIDASLYDNGLFRYAGKLVITQHSANMNNPAETTWNGFFTIGSASFFQEIKDVRMQDINYGGIRSFPWTGNIYNDGSNGFWQHLHAARSPNLYPYTFYPIKNEGWSDEHNVRWMNRLDPGNTFYSYTTGETDLFNSNVISITPSIYYSFILEKIFTQYGWTISGDVLSDPGFIKATMPSFKAIHWADFKKIPFPANGYFFTFPANVTFDLADHVPQDVTVGSFIANLKNRFGWYFDFDSSSKTAYLRSNKSLITAGVKDWTQYTLAKYSSEYQDGTKTYSLVNNIDPADTFPVLPVIKYNTLQVPAASEATLPANAGYADGDIIYALLENQYYINRWIVEQAHTHGSYMLITSVTMSPPVLTLQSNLISALWSRVE